MIISVMLTLRERHAFKYNLFLYFLQNENVFPNYHGLGQFPTKKYGENYILLHVPSPTHPQEDFRLTVSRVYISSRLSLIQRCIIFQPAPLITALWSSQDNKEPLKMVPAAQYPMSTFI